MGKIKNEYPFTEVRGNNIRINFRFEGKKYTPSMNLEPTPKNLKYASNVAFEIRQKIKAGVFMMSDYFPELVQSTDVPTFGDIASQYIATIQHLAPSTINSYRKILNATWLPYLGDTEIHKITYGMLAKILGTCDFKSAKTRNNTIIPVRGIFKLSLRDGHISSNPSLGLEYQKYQAPVRDPLTIDEVFLFLNAVKNKQWQNYFRLAFFTGMRTSELIELKWSDIDFVRSDITISRARVQKKVKPTKTYKSRIIGINDEVKAALSSQKQFTFMKGDYVFINPGTDEPINNDKPPRVIWTDTLKKVGLRHRACYQTRSTSVCLMLQAEYSPYMVAEHHGHSLNTMMKHYAKWMKSESDNDRMNALIKKNKMKGGLK